MEQQMPDSIDFERRFYRGLAEKEPVKNRPLDAELVAKGNHWAGVSGQLGLLMEASGLDQTSMIEAALWAVIEALDTDAYSNISFREAKVLIAQCLNTFRELGDLDVENVDGRVRPQNGRR
jgi:hypothetical protein